MAAFLIAAVLTVLILYVLGKAMKAGSLGRAFLAWKLGAIIFIGLWFLLSQMGA